MTATQTQTAGRRRWTVCPGTDGHGPVLFEVYAVTMEEARESVMTTTQARRDAAAWDLLDAGFTVHAIQPQDVGAGALAGNPYAYRIPAPDFPRELANA